MNKDIGQNKILCPNRTCFLLNWMFQCFGNFHFIQIAVFQFLEIIHLPTKEIHEHSTGASCSFTGAEVLLPSAIGQYCNFSYRIACFSPLQLASLVICLSTGVPTNSHAFLLFRLSFSPTKSFEFNLI